MPIYEYQCAACGRTFEAWQKITDHAVGKCQHCGSRRVSKLISHSSFHLKGSGWYKTDYAGKGNGAETKKASTKKGTDPKAGASKKDGSTPSAAKADTAPEKKVAAAGE